MNPASALAPPEWTEEALCHQVDPDLWFPEKGHSEQAHTAMAICRRCPVTAECLDYALANDEQFGIWGGKSARARRKHRKDTTS